jgi:uncharacterized protein with von Willebrand factor type A (vWA) domain
VSTRRSDVLAQNVMHFARLLREAGLPVGTDRVHTAIQTLGVIDLRRRDDVYQALHATLVSRREHREIFEHAFRIFFRERGGHEDLLAAMLPTGTAAPDPNETPRRLREAFRKAKPRAPEPTPSPPPRLDALLSASTTEVLRNKDFEEMSAEELRRAKEIIARLPLTSEAVATRRLRPDPRGARLDLRAMLRDGLRAGPDHMPLRWQGRVRRPPPIVALCDISGSMERYVRVLLHFLHALGNAREHVDVFLFGTRLTPVTRALRHRDPDVAIGKLADEVLDWSGGTRIGETLREFNRRWSRRLLAQGAQVMLITDGLERDDPALLEQEAARLHRSCRKLLWLNPLLRFEEFEPVARGIKALLPHVDSFLPMHDLESLEDLARVLSREERGRPRRHRRTAA